MATAITYQQAKTMLDTAMDSLQRAMRKRVTSAHGRMLQAQEVDRLQNMVDTWDRKVTELDPAIDSSIQVGQMVPR
jgi:hypothetical protein